MPGQVGPVPLGGAVRPRDANGVADLEPDGYPDANGVADLEPDGYPDANGVADLEPDGYPDANDVANLKRERVADFNTYSDANSDLNRLHVCDLRLPRAL